VAEPWVLLSKPLRPPYRDGTSVLVRNLLRRLDPTRPVTYFGDPRAPVRPAGDRVLPAAAMAWQPGGLEKAVMLARLLAPGIVRHPIHAFFAANRSSSLVLDALARLPRRRTVLHTLPASAGAEAIVRWLDRLDGVIVTSDHGRQRLVEAGLAEARVRRIYPGVEPEEDPEPAREPLDRRRVVLFAGDLDPAVVERLVAVARVLERHPEWRLELAVRPKADRDAELRRALAQRLAPAIERGRVRLRAEVEDMPALLRSAAIQLYLADHARRKVDIPFALLEGMAAGVPVAVVDAPPVAEILALGDLHGTPAGLRLPAHDPDAGAEALAELLSRPAELCALGAGARALVCDHFSAQAMAQQYQHEHARLA
jgi:glycosyltransferase involved in cell wall biosynthesis